MTDEKILDLFSTRYSRSWFSIEKFIETDTHGGFPYSEKRIAKAARTNRQTGGANWRKN